MINTYPHEVVNDRYRGNLAAQEVDDEIVKIQQKMSNVMCL